MERNLTTGSVLKNLMFFSLPYLLSYFLQTLYGMADLFIVGQFDGVASTTAVSVGSQVMHMLTVMIVGLAMGTTVTIGQAVGAKNRKKISHTIGNTVILFCIVSAQHITSSVPFFVAWVIPKARCTLLQSPVVQTLPLIIFLWGHCIWDRRGLPWERRWRRL